MIVVGLTVLVVVGIPGAQWAIGSKRAHHKTHEAIRAEEAGRTAVVLEVEINIR
jgi:hypothetical protein